MSRTFPRATSGNGRSVCWIAVVIASHPELWSRLAHAVAGEQRVHVLGQERVHLFGRTADVPRGVQRLEDLFPREPELGIGHEPVDKVVLAALLHLVRRGLGMTADALVQRLPVAAPPHGL